MIPLETQVYELPETTDLQFFTSEAHFIRKLQKHFLSENEPWSRLFGVKFLQQLGRKLEADDVSTLNDAYRQAVTVLDEGLRFAAGRPLYLRIREILTTKGRPVRQQRVMFLLAKPGFRIVVHSGFVQTAYFQTKTRNDSYFTLFREAWGSLRARGLLRRSEGHYRTIERLDTEWHSESTWSKCPNPHPPGLRRGRALPSDIEAWLAKIDEVGQ